MKFFAAILIALIALQAVLVNGSSSTCVSDLHDSIVTNTDLGLVVYVAGQLTITEKVLLVAVDVVAALLVSIIAYLSQLVIAVEIVVAYIVTSGVAFDNVSVNAAIDSVQASVAAIVDQCGLASPSESTLITAVGQLGIDLQTFSTVINKIVTSLDVTIDFAPQVIVSLVLVHQIIVFGIDACINALAVPMSVVAQPAYVSLVNCSGQIVASSTNIVTKTQSCYEQSIDPVPSTETALNDLVILQVPLVASLTSIVNNLLNSLGQ